MIINVGWLGYLTALVLFGLGLYISIKYLWSRYYLPNTFGGYFVAFWVQY